MLTAIVVQLQPVAAVRLPISHGSFAHAATANLILRLNPLLSHLLHEQDDRQPFTCSPLLDADQRDGFDYVLSPERTYAWRLTGLTQEVSEQLLRISSALGGINFKDAVFTIVDVSTSAEMHPDAGQSSYESLLSHWERHDPPRSVSLRVCTPATFRVGRDAQPFPLPGWVFNSLLSTWNRFSPYPFEDPQVIPDQDVALRNWRGETKRVELGGHGAPGFVGKFTYRAANRDPDFSRLLGLLADFSFYAGIGWQTTHGLGQTRPQWPDAKSMG